MAVLVAHRRSVSDQSFSLPSCITSPNQLGSPLGYVRSALVNSDGFTAKGITFPSVEAQRDLSARTCAKAGLLPSDIDYIEAHGTGTVAGDGVELKALDEVGI